MNRAAYLIPVFNDQDGLDRSLSSLSRQSRHFDVVVVDDGSVPAMVVNAEAYPFSVQLIALEENQGIEAALNAGAAWIDQQGYEFIARLDAGDTVMPDRNEKQLTFLDSEPECGVVGSWVQMVDESDVALYELRHPIRFEDITRKHRINNAMAHPSVMIRTSVLRRVGFYSDQFKAAEDFELWLRLQKVTQLRNLGECLVRKQLSLASISARRRRRQTTSRLRLLLREFDVRRPESYVGIGHCAASFLFSYSSVARIRQAAFRLTRRLQPVASA